MNRKILGNSFFMDLYLTGISRLERAPGRQVTQAEGYTEPQADHASTPSPPQHTHHKIQVCSWLCIIWLYCNQLSPWRASVCILNYSGCRCSSTNPPVNMHCWFWDTTRWEYPPCDCCCLKEQLFYRRISPQGHLPPPALCPAQVMNWDQVETNNQDFLTAADAGVMHGAPRACHQTLLCVSNTPHKQLTLWLL